jgi:RNAse (barnase) inhibitor barstar
MTDLSLRLKDIKEVGVYIINCELSDVRKAANEAGYTVFDADLATVQSKSEFLAAVAQAIEAPEWFGKNWDALADALGDLSWKPAPGYVLVLRNGLNTFNLLESDHEIAKEILDNTVSYWKTQHKPFWVFSC